MFLIQRDFQIIFNTDDITTILTDNTVKDFEILNSSIDFAVDYVKSKIQHRYNADSVFIDVNTFDITETYAIGDLIIYSESAFDITTAYNSGERVSYEGYIYKAKSTTTGNLPTDDTYWEQITTNYSFYSCAAESTGNYPDDTDFFKNGDTRHSLIKNYCVYIAIDNMFPHINPRVVPEWIVGKKEMAESHLNRISSGKDQVNLTVATNADGEEEGHTFTYGTETKRSLDY